MLLVAIAVLIAALAFADPAKAAAPARLSTAVWATWYGPGFYGRDFACEGVDKFTPSSYRPNVRGTAHMTLPCGTPVTICKPLGKLRRCVRVRVIDRGNFGHAFDLTARTSMDLCRCPKPYTMLVTWKRGWS